MYKYDYYSVYIFIEFRAGTILCLVNTERIESKPNEATQIMRGSADVLYIGNESIGVMPPFIAPFQGNEHERNTCLLQDSLQEGGGDQDIVPHEPQLQDSLQEGGRDQDVVPHEAYYQEYTWYYPIEEEGWDQSTSQLVVSLLSLLPRLPCDAELVIPPFILLPRLPCDAELVLGIVPYTKMKKSDTAFPAEKPSFPKKEQPRHLPTDIKDKEHGDLIYAEVRY